MGVTLGDGSEKILAKALLATAWGASGSAGQSPSGPSGGLGGLGLLLQIQEEATQRLQLGLPLPTVDILGIAAACKFSGCVRAGFLQASDLRTIGRADD